MLHGVLHILGQGNMLLIDIEKTLFYLLEQKSWWAKMLTCD